MKRQLRVHLLVARILWSGAWSAGQTSSAPATRAAPDLSTPQKAAAAYFKGLTAPDGALLLAAVDLRDEGVKKVMTARAAQVDAYAHYTAAAKKAFGNVPEQFLPPTLNNGMMQLVMGSLDKAEVKIEGDHAVLTPKLDAGGGGDMGQLFRMSLVKSGDAWRVVPQDSAEMFRMGVDGSERAQAEMTAAEAPEVEAVALEIGKGTYKDAQAAWTEMQKRTEAAGEAVQARWAAEKAGKGTQPAATQR